MRGRRRTKTIPGWRSALKRKTSSKGEMFRNEIHKCVSECHVGVVGVSGVLGGKMEKDKEGGKGKERSKKCKIKSRRDKANSLMRQDQFFHLN